MSFGKGVYCVSTCIAQNVLQAYILLGYEQRYVHYVQRGEEKRHIFCVYKSTLPP